MRHSPIAAAPAVALAAFLAGCTTGSPTDSQEGSLTVALAATRSSAAAATAPPHDRDALSQLSEAKITVTSVEAHQAEGSWVVVDAGLPATIDLIELLEAGSSVSFPPDSIPEESYDALQLRVAKVELKLKNGTPVEIPSTGGGWAVRVPVGFTVVPGEIVTIHLDLRCDTSFQVVDGTFSFDPQIEVEAVSH